MVRVWPRNTLATIGSTLTDGNGITWYGKESTALWSLLPYSTPHLTTPRNNRTMSYAKHRTSTLSSRWCWSRSTDNVLLVSDYGKKTARSALGVWPRNDLRLWWRFSTESEFKSFKIILCHLKYVKYYLLDVSTKTYNHNICKKNLPVYNCV